MSKTATSSNPGVAAGPHGPWLPWETVVSTCWFGAGEDGGFLWSGGFNAQIVQLLFTTPQTDHILSSVFLFQLYSLFLTAAAGHLTAGQNSVAAWANAMLAGTQAMKRLTKTDVNKIQKFKLKYIFLHEKND